MNIKVNATPYKDKQMVEWGVLCPTKPNKGDLCLVTAKNGKQWICLIRTVCDKHNNGWVCLTDKVVVSIDMEAEERRNKLFQKLGLQAY